jgi:glycine/D-amino acid oxidase-like deaminating enzyme
MPNKNQLQEHTSSYYAATATEYPGYEPLRGAQTADICVVGAGFTGIATALTLSERGYKVAVVEANRVGWGASGRNGGQIICGISGASKLQKKHGETIADLLWDMKWRGNDIIFDRVKKYAIDCDLKSGYIEVALKDRQVGYLEDDMKELQRRNFPYEYRMFDKAETRNIVGTDAYVGSMTNMRNGHLHPLNLCLGEARAAVELGATIYEQSPVTEIVHGDKPKVMTANGHVEADAVVLAGNAYHALERKHLSGLTFPAGSYIIATEPLSQDVINEINPQDLAICDLNEVVDYYRLSADGRLLYGGRCNYSGREPTSIKASILPRMLKTYPQLKDVRIDYEWGGNVGIVLNRIPALGRINGNVWYSQGYSGHGVNTTHIMGEVIADAMAGQLEKFDLFAKVKHHRIPGSQWLGNQMIAMGMLYYRLRDLM